MTGANFNEQTLRDMYARVEHAFYGPPRPMPDSVEMATRRIANICVIARERGWLAKIDTSLRGYSVSFRSPAGNQIAGPIEPDLRGALARACDKIADRL